MRLPFCIVLALCIALPILARGQSSTEPGMLADLQNAIMSLYEDAIVKIEVTTNTPVFREIPPNRQSINICASQGTGFLISPSHIVTAEHVYNLPAECGARIIIIKSRRHRFQALATIVDAYNDTAMLRVQEVFPATMCSLRVTRTDVFNQPAFRFGIAGNLQDPRVESTRIASSNSEFSPLALLIQTFAEPGDSGGPIVYGSVVTGVTRARHPQYPAMSFMTPAAAVRELMRRHRVRPEPRQECSLVRRYGYDGEEVAINVPISPQTAQQVIAAAATELAQWETGFAISPTPTSLVLQDPNGATRPTSRVPFVDRPTSVSASGDIRTQQLSRVAASELERQIWSRLESSPATERRVIAEIPAPMSNATCRRQECALGNIVAASLLEAAPGTEVAVFNAGGLRSGLPSGPITNRDVLAVLPFRNRVVTVAVRGSELLAALENGFSIGAGAGRFPQVAGIRIVWDEKAPPGQRVRSVLVARSDGQYQPLDLQQIYQIATSDYLRRGGDGYVMFRDASLRNENADSPDDGLFIDVALSEILASGRFRAAGVEAGRIVSQ